MSERGSWVSEYVYCKKCFEATRDFFTREGKYLAGLTIYDFPIIAGKIGGLSSDEEIQDFSEYLSDLGKFLCHEVSFVVISDVGTVVLFTVESSSLGPVYPASVKIYALRASNATPRYIKETLWKGPKDV